MRTVSFLFLWVMALSLWAVFGVMVAHSHTGYKGHDCKYWTNVYPGGVQVAFKECHISGYGAGPHFHDYRTRQLDETCGDADGCGWQIVHTHWGRLAETHPV